MGSVMDIQQKVLTYGGKFKQIFHTSLRPMMDIYTGFDLFAFEDFIGGTKECESLENKVRAVYGEEAVKLINILIG